MGECVGHDGVPGAPKNIGVVKSRGHIGLPETRLCMPGKIGIYDPAK